MPKREIPTVANYFESVTDPRRENRRHKLIDIISIAICAVISNADSYEHIAEYGSTTSHIKFRIFSKR